MASIFENTRSKVTVHILHDDTLTDSNRQKFIRTAEKYSQGIELHDVTGYRNNIREDVVLFFRNTFTVGALYRLAMHEILPFDKVIYLDGDTLVNLDIRELWEIDVGDNYLAAARDEVIYTEGERSKFSYWAVAARINGCRASTYINSGVLVMNLNEIRGRGDFFAEASRYTIEHLHTYMSADQKVFNSLFYGKIKLIDQKFNRQLWDYDSDLSDSIIHTNKRKSWRVYPEMYAERLYWKMYLRSAWGENITRDEFVDVIANIKPEQSEFLHPSPRQCFVRIIRGVWRRGSLSGLRRVVSLVARDMYHRLTHH